MLFATARVKAPVPFGTIATSTFAAAFVAVIETTGTVAFGAAVFTHSVKLVSQAHPDGAAYVQSARKKFVVPPAVVRVTQFTDLLVRD